MSPRARALAMDDQMAPREFAAHEPHARPRGAHRDHVRETLEAARAFRPGPVFIEITTVPPG